MARILVLYNPLPDAAREARLEMLMTALAANSAEVTLLPTSAVLTETQQAFDALAITPDRVIVVGGDGTLQQAVNLFHHRSIPLGYIPAGTGNDFARHWLGAMDSKKYIEIAIHGSAESLDLGFVAGASFASRYFINSVGIGFDGALIRSLPNKIPYFPKVSYLWRALKMLFRYQGQGLQLEHNNKASLLAEQEPVFMLVIANGPYYGAGMKIAPHAQVQDGQLSYLLIKECRLFTKLWSLASIYTGKHLLKPMVTHGHLGVLAVTSPAVPMQIDGEYLGSTPARFEVAENAIQIARTLN